MSTGQFESVRVVVDPYDHDEIQSLLRKIVDDFGHDRSRWYFRFDTNEFDQNRGNLLFFFRDTHDAVMFGLKYTQ